jgi:hypothetical protein
MERQVNLLLGVRRPPVVTIGNMPMVKDGEYIAIFNSVHRVMKAEKMLKGEKLPILLIPAPRSLSSDCGLAIRYSSQDREKTEQLLRDGGLSPEEIYVKAGDRYAQVDRDG